MIIHRFVTSTILGTILCLGGYSPAFAQVDCTVDPPGSLQVALNTGSTFVTFTGTCTEDISIQRSNVRLRGSGESTASVLSVFIDGASVRLERFTVDGGGVSVIRGSYADIDRLTIDDSRLQVSESSGARLRRSTLNGPNDDFALAVFRDSSVRLRGDNDITGNDSATPAVSVNSSSNFVMINGGDTLVGASPVLRVRQSNAELRRGVITGDVIVDLHSVVSVGAGEFVEGFPNHNITLNGDVTISRDSALVFDIPDTDTVTFNGLATCLDDESSVSGGPPAGNGVIDCTGFSAVAGPPEPPPPGGPSGMGPP